jgi:hypothetical protein
MLRRVIRSDTAALLIASGPPRAAHPLKSIIGKAERVVPLG